MLTTYHRSRGQRATQKTVSAGSLESRMCTRRTKKKVTKKKRCLLKTHVPHLFARFTLSPFPPFKFPLFSFSHFYGLFFIIIEFVQTPAIPFTTIVTTMGKRTMLFTKRRFGTLRQEKPKCNCWFVTSTTFATIDRAGRKETTGRVCPLTITGYCCCLSGCNLWQFYFWRFPFWQSFDGFDVFFWLQTTTVSTFKI